MSSGEVTFTVKGTPVAKGRPRSFTFADKTGKTRIGHHTPKKTVTYEGLVHATAVQAMGAREPFTGPVQMIVRMAFLPSESWPKWKKQLVVSNMVMPTGKPDIDNVVKAVKDAIKGVVYMDDSQVVRAGLIKEYGPYAEINVKVKQLDAHPCRIKRRPEH